MQAVEGQLQTLAASSSANAADTCVAQPNARSADKAALEADNDDAKEMAARFL